MSNDNRMKNCEAMKEGYAGPDILKRVLCQKTKCPYGYAGEVILYQKEKSVICTSDGLVPIKRTPEIQESIFPPADNLAFDRIQTPRGIEVIVRRTN